MSTNINVMVNFDEIVDKCSKDDDGIYTKCHDYVNYYIDGKKITKKTGLPRKIVLNHKCEYNMTLAVPKDCISKPQGLQRFTDNDVTFTKNKKLNPCKLQFQATKINESGDAVFLMANFIDQNGFSCTARWDPVVVVTTKPPQ